MDFIEVVIEIAKRPELGICPNLAERLGMRDVCVYRTVNGVTEEFLGKLCWPKGVDTVAYVEDSIIDYLQNDATIHH